MPGDIARRWPAVVHRIGTVAVVPAASTWAGTSAALGVSIVKRAWRAASTRLRSVPRPTPPHPGHPAGMRRYTFEALVTIPSPRRNPAAPAPGPDWHGVIRASGAGDGRSPGLFSALVSGWDMHAARRGRDVEALATIVAFGSEPADRLPVGGTFALWRGHDVAHGVVTRRIFG